MVWWVIQFVQSFELITNDRSFQESSAWKSYYYLAEVAARERKKNDVILAHKRFSKVKKKIVHQSWRQFRFESHWFLLLFLFHSFLTRINTSNDSFYIRIKKPLFHTAATEKFFQKNFFPNTIRRINNMR